MDRVDVMWGFRVVNSELTLTPFDFNWNQEDLEEGRYTTATTSFLHTI